MSVKLASFPNSRIKPRPATRVAVTSEVNITSAGPVTILPANENRTIATLFNSGANDIRYQYATSVGILASGFLLKAGGSIDLESPEEIFGQAIGADSLCYVDEGEG